VVVPDAALVELEAVPDAVELAPGPVVLAPELALAEVPLLVAVVGPVVPTVVVPPVTPLAEAPARWMLPEFPQAARSSKDQRATLNMDGLQPRGYPAMPKRTNWVRCLA
jgi:hypothetical protein